MKLLEQLDLCVQVKGLDAKERTFEGLLATWDLDLGDDIIHKGAFKEWLGEWKRSRETIPLLDTHSTTSIFSAVGKLIDARETAKGLWTKWYVIEGPDGDGVLNRVKGGVITKMSVGYDPKEFHFEENDDARFGIIRHLTKMGVGEGSLVLRPMQPGADIDIDSVKALLAKDELRQGEIRVLRKLRDQIGERLAALDGKETPDPEPDDEPEPDPEPDDDEPEPDDEDTEEGADDAPKQEPARRTPADDDAPDVAVLDRLRLRRLGYSFNPQTLEA